MEEIIILSSNLLFITDPEDKIRIQILKLSILFLETFRSDVGLRKRAAVIFFDGSMRKSFENMPYSIVKGNK